MSYIVSIGALTFTFNENERELAFNFAQTAAISSNDKACVTIMLNPDNK